MTGVVSGNQTRQHSLLHEQGYLGRKVIIWRPEKYCSKLLRDILQILDRIQLLLERWRAWSSLQKDICHGEKGTPSAQIRGIPCRLTQAKGKQIVNLQLSLSSPFKLSVPGPTWAARIFVPKGLSVDRLQNIPGKKSTWHKDAGRKLEEHRSRCESMKYLSRTDLSLLRWSIDCDALAIVASIIWAGEMACAGSDPLGYSTLGRPWALSARKY
jgi:hypothetical protein